MTFFGRGEEGRKILNGAIGPIARRFGLDKNQVLFSALSIEILFHFAYKYLLYLYLGASSVGGYVTAKYSYKQCEETYGFFQAAKSSSR